MTERRYTPRRGPADSGLIAHDAAAVRRTRVGPDEQPARHGGFNPGPAMLAFAFCTFVLGGFSFGWLFFANWRLLQLPGGPDPPSGSAPTIAVPGRRDRRGRSPGPGGGVVVPPGVWVPLDRRPAPADARSPGADRRPAGSGRTRGGSTSCCSGSTTATTSRSTGAAATRSWWSASTRRASRW